MASEELTEQFQFLGIEVDNQVLNKCVCLCEEYGIDAETFTELWMAFSLTHLNGAAPTPDNLDLLVRKEFSKRAITAGRAGVPAPARQVDGASAAGLTIYGAPTSAKTENEEVLSNYICGTPKRVKVENDPTPAHQNELCPATYSPTVAHSAKYASRSNQGSVVHSFGDEILLQQLSKPNAAGDILDLNATQVPNDDGEIYTKAMFGFELLHEKASTFDNHIRYVSQCIMKKAGIKETASVRHKTQTEVFVAGRIECDADARLNPQSVVLQGTWAESLSQTVPVDLDNLKQYSLFPGQVVVMRGVNPRGDKFVAHEVFDDATQPLPDHGKDLINTFTGTMSILVASGPYTTSDNLTYEPLKDLVSYIAAYKPHGAILTGPFLDCEHSKVKDNSMAETYKAFFDKLLDSLGELSVSSPYTKIYLVPHVRDAFHVNIYPSPAYSSRKRHPNVHFLPEPSTLNIGGVVVAVTSTDVLMHVSQEEISLGMPGDKLSRLCSHVLRQQCLYPLWPPNGTPVDAALWASHAQLSTTPHVLVLPSNFRYFVKDVNGCMVVNPEHVTKGTGGGTLARLLVAVQGAERKVAAQVLRI